MGSELTPAVERHDGTHPSRKQSLVDRGPSQAGIGRYPTGVGVGEIDEREQEHAPYEPPEPPRSLWRLWRLWRLCRLSRFSQPGSRNGRILKFWSIDLCVWGTWIPGTAEDYVSRSAVRGAVGNELLPRLRSLAAAEKHEQSSVIKVNK